MDNKKYSSFENNQVITEEWRKYLKEEKSILAEKIDEGISEPPLLTEIGPLLAVGWILRGLASGTGAMLKWMAANPKKTALIAAAGVAAYSFSGDDDDDEDEKGEKSDSGDAKIGSNEVSQDYIEDITDKIVDDLDIPIRVNDLQNTLKRVKKLRGKFVAQGFFGGGKKVTAINAMMEEYESNEWTDRGGFMGVITGPLIDKPEEKKIAKEIIAEVEADKSGGGTKASAPQKAKKGAPRSQSEKAVLASASYPDITAMVQEFIPNFRGGQRNVDALAAQLGLEAGGTGQDGFRNYDEMKSKMRQKLQSKHGTKSAGEDEEEEMSYEDPEVLAGRETGISEAKRSIIRTAIKKINQG